MERKLVGIHLVKQQLLEWSLGSLLLEQIIFQPLAPQERDLWFSGLWILHTQRYLQWEIFAMI